MTTAIGPTDLCREPNSQPYTAEMAKRVRLGVEDFRKYLKSRVDAAENGEETIVQKRGKVVAALIPIDWYRDLRERAGDPTDY